MKEVHAIVDMQFGSCGKGLFAGYLADKLQPDTIVTAWGPNAGHTFIDRDGEKYTNIMLPNGIIASGRLAQVLLGPGSIINPDILLEEWNRYQRWMEPIQLMIHESAAIVLPEHREREAQYGFGIGSTMKGVGEAVIDKIRRKAVNELGNNIAKFQLRGTPLGRFVVSKDVYDMALDTANKVLIEGAQGYSLGINSGFYPYCTSRECSIWQLLSDCGIPANGGKLSVYGVARTYPIRVANRFKWVGGREDCAHEQDQNGNCRFCAADYQQVGTSGPCYEDQRELQWSDLGREPELTTVTKLPRRVFTFSEQQIRQAVRANGIRSVFLNFANYCKTDAELQEKIDAIQRTGARVRWLGWGPSINDVKETI